MGGHNLKGQSQITVLRLDGEKPAQVIHSNLVVSIKKHTWLIDR